MRASQYSSENIISEFCLNINQCGGSMVSVVSEIEECLSYFVVGFEYARYFLAKTPRKNQLGFCYSFTPINNAANALVTQALNS